MAGSVIKTPYYISQRKSEINFFPYMLVIKLACIGDAVDGSVPDTYIDGSQIRIGRSKDSIYNLCVYSEVGFELSRVVLNNPGGTAPGSSWNIKIGDSRGFDLMEGNGIGLGNSTHAIYGNMNFPITEDITVRFSGQEVANATWDAYIYFKIP